MDSFGQNRLAESRLHSIPEHKINPTIEQLLKEELQVHVVVEGLVVELDKEVQVARLGGLVTHGRPEQRQTPDPERPNPVPIPGQQLQQFVTRPHHWFIIASLGQLSPGAKAVNPRLQAQVQIFRFSYWELETGNW
jgi:hypothetical protein